MHGERFLTVDLGLFERVQPSPKTKEFRSISRCKERQHAATLILYTHFENIEMLQIGGQYRKYYTVYCALYICKNAKI